MLAVVFNKRRGNVSNLICGIVRLMALRALITSSLELESMQGDTAFCSSHVDIRATNEGREAFRIIKKAPTMKSFKNLC